ncbi:PcfJ domain-containing protein [Vagococcus fluvialis]|uniref:PcfJ domain-containing protein n=1 Tax=Vagococcus fluvialis TaxID=2738 RepID=UPI001A907012|nr:PcfJ domain-containing protein [Vagococcus fluvialis]MBO0444307.1 PcfJ domain-containing protein [Vagococcus fluvialis]
MTNQLSKEIGKTLTPPKDFFKWCESQIPIFEWSNKEKTIKSSERTDCELIKKRLTKNSRLTFSVKFYQFSIILVSKNRIEIQSHDYWQEIKEGKEILSKRLTNFERFENGKHIKAYNTYNNQWDNGLRTSYGFMSGNYTNTIFYPNNWQSKLKNNRDLKYLTLPRIQRQDISRIYKYRYEIEYLQKIGNKRLAENIMFTGKLPYGTDYYSTVDMTTINKNWLKKNKSLLKNSDKSFNEIMLELCFKKQNIKMIDNIARLVHYKQLKKLPKEISLNKFINYFKKNNFSIDYYLDYIYMLQELGTPLKSDLVIFPKDIKKAHDDLVSVIGKLERELEEKAYQKQLPKIRKYEQEIDEFMFLVPKDLQEIVNEGNALHHCVGGKHYLDNHTKGNTNIIFIRQKDEVEKPYFTLEYKNQHVAQVQGKYNRETVPNDLQKAINKWEDKIKRIS